MSKPQQRASLGTFAPQVVQADDAKIIPDASMRAAPQSQRPASVTVYLTPDEIRMLKLIGIEHRKKLTDICATAVREWLQRNGHVSGKRFKA
jgi:hypothetical protein